MHFSSNNVQQVACGMRHTLVLLRGNCLPACLPGLHHYAMVLHYYIGCLTVQLHFRKFVLPRKMISELVFSLALVFMHKSCSVKGMSRLHSALYFEMLNCYVI